MEIHRTLGLIAADKKSEDIRTEREFCEALRKEIQGERALADIHIQALESILGSSSSNSDPFPTEDEIAQLQKHIEQLRAQLKEKPDQEYQQKLLVNAESRLHSILEQKAAKDE